MSTHTQDSIKQNESIDSEQLPNDFLQQRFDLIEENAPKSKEQFYSQSFHIFSRLNKCIKGNDSAEYKESKKTEISHIVSEYVDLVHEFPDVSQFEDIWDMANLLYFSSKENDLVTDLNDWVNQYSGEEDYEDSIEAAICHMLRGNFIEAIEALNDSADILNPLQHTATLTIIQLLKKFQALQPIRNNKSKYATEWTALHEECGVQLENFLRDFEDLEETDLDHDIKIMFSILNGDEDFILYAKGYYERIIGCILYSRPTITMSDLAHLAQRTIRKNEHTVCSYIMMGCFDDAFELIDDLWLQTHLGHALVAVGAKTTDQVQVESIETEYIIDPIYYCINQYATMLAEKFDLWKEAVIYITACVENKEIWIKKLLSDSPTRSKDMNLLNYVLDVAKEFDLNNLQKDVHKMMGHCYEEKKEFKNATIEYGKAHDMEALDRFAHREFSLYLKTGQLGDVVTDMEELKECPHYALLILYRNFRMFLEKKEWKKASQLFLQLLGYDRLPTKFEMVLLTDNLAILEDSKQHYSLDQLIEQIKLFKTVTLELSDQDFLAKYYKFIYHKQLPSTTVTAILREKMVNKAVIASN